jgi:hypothetical protein
MAKDRYLLCNILMIYVDNYRKKFLDNLVIQQLGGLGGGFFCLHTRKYCIQLEDQKILPDIQLGGREIWPATKIED